MIKRKYVFLWACALLLSSCATETVNEGIPEPTVEVSPEVTEMPDETAGSIDVWDVDPVYEYDDIDTSFADHWHFGRDDYLNYALIYSMKDPYNSAKSPAFTGAVEKGAIFVYKNGCFGVMDSSGNLTFDPQYDQYNNWTSMLINQSAVMACEVQYDYSVGYCTDAWGVGGAYQHYGSLTADAMILDNINHEPFSVYDLHADAVADGVIADDEYFVYDAQRFDHNSEDVIEGYVAVGKDSYTQLTDGFAKKLVTFSDQILLIASESKSGGKTDFEFLNMDGTILSSGYEDAYGFFEGYAPVKKDGKWGYIDRNGQCVTGFIFDKATPVSDRKAWVIYHGRTGKINILEMIENNVPFSDSVLNVQDYQIIDPTKWIEIKVKSINIRNQPSVSGEKIASVQYGDIIPYTDQLENEGYTWYQISHDRWIADQNGEWISEIQ